VEQELGVGNDNRVGGRMDMSRIDVEIDRLRAQRGVKFTRVIQGATSKSL